MKRTSGELLEFEELKGLVGRYVAGPLGRAELNRLQPSDDREFLERTLAEVAQAMEFVRENGRLPLGGLVDTNESVARLRIEGAALEASEIADLTRFLERADEVRGLLANQQFPLLARRSSMMADFRGLLREIGGKVLPNGSIADDASVALHRLRRDIERQQRSIHQSLERFLKSHRDEGVL